METQRLHAIAYEVFRTLNGLNPNFMKDTFYRSSNLTHRIDNLCSFPKHYKVLNKSLWSFGAPIWNLMPENIK